MTPLSCTAQCSPWFCRSAKVLVTRSHLLLPQTFSPALWITRKSSRNYVRNSGFFTRKHQTTELGWSRNCVALDGCRSRYKATSSIHEALFKIARAALSALTLIFRLDKQIITDIFELHVLFGEVMVEVEELLIGEFLFEVSILAWYHQVSIRSGRQVATTHLN